MQLGLQSGRNAPFSSFRSLASKCFPGGYSKMCARVCARFHSETPNLRRGFVNDACEHPRRHHVADGPLSSLYAPSPSLSSFKDACDGVLFRLSFLFDHTLCATRASAWS